MQTNSGPQSSNDPNYGPSGPVGASSQGMPANNSTSFEEKNPEVPSSNSQEWLDQNFKNTRANARRFFHG